MKGFYFLLTFLLSTYVSKVQGQNKTAADKLSSGIIESIRQQNEDWISIHLVLTQQLNFDSWHRTQDALRSDVSLRSKSLINTLKVQAANTQSELINFLQNAKQVQTQSIKTHWLANAVSCVVKKDFIIQLAERQDIQWIGQNMTLLPTWTTESASESVLTPEGKEKGLTAIGAPQMWALGYTGYNRLVFTADTGVDPTHPALKSQYNGLYTSDNQSWYSYQGGGKPRDCDKHGTHVTGTILGLDKLKNDTIGVAFNARWIGGDILCGIGTEDNIGAFEWALDPDGNPDTTDDIPDVINNSWYDPSLNGMDCFSIYVPILEALEAAGIAVVFSAGNDGPEPGTITTPHNININEVNAFTVGALNGNTPSFPIAGFSSVGPSHCDGDGSLKIKPEVSAPGVNVRSCLPGNNYGMLSGTSMAAPHVSGALLLLKEAFPYLNGKDLKLALYRSAKDLGEPGEDNKYGMGIINVYDAYNYLIAQGYQPESVFVNNDVVLLNVKNAEIGCDNKLNPHLLVENAGADTLISAEIVFMSKSFTTSINWEGLILPKERTYISVFLSDLPSTAENIKVSIQRPNGKADQRPDNNYSEFRTNISERLPASLDYTFKENICVNSSLYLNIPQKRGLNPTSISWYDNQFDGKLIKEGNKILIKEIEGIRSVYAEPRYNDVAGIPSYQTQNGTYDNANGEGIIFDAQSDFILDTVTVYSEQIAIRSFALINGNGDTIYIVKKYINKPGPNIVKLNWNIPAGNNYKIIKKDGKPLFKSTANVQYPYKDLQNILNIRSGTNGGDYNYFYNWKISYSEPCGRIPYFINVRKDSIAGKADFSISKDTLFLPNDNKLSLVSRSENVISYLWDMGDGSAYDIAEFNHSYTIPGEYKIILQILDNNECLSSSENQVVVLQISTSSDESVRESNFGLKYYPNPTDGILHIETDDTINSGIKFTLTDILGNEYRNETGQMPKKSNHIDMYGLPSGVYFLKTQKDTKIHVVKILKL